MGKIRVRTLGSEEQEKKEKKQAQARAVAKEAKEQKTPVETMAAKPAEEASADKPEKKQIRKELVKKQKRGSSYVSASSILEKDKVYKLTEALSFLPKLQRAKFDETVELHINTVEKGISGNVVLPHGTGRQVRITIANAGSDTKGVDELVKRIESGQIDFDVLIATPDSMSKLARVAKVLGPRGLMPNPKNGTVTPRPEEVAEKFKGGQVNFKTESKFPILHVAVGKVSFGDKKLEENIKAMVQAVKVNNIRNMTLKSTMSPGLKVDTASI
jgi:large subunit ribosomal protein L1